MALPSKIKLIEHIWRFWWENYSRNIIYWILEQVRQNKPEIRPFLPNLSLIHKTGNVVPGSSPQASLRRLSWRFPLPFCLEFSSRKPIGHQDMPGNAYFIDISMNIIRPASRKRGELAREEDSCFVWVSGERKRGDSCQLASVRARLQGIARNKWASCMVEIVTQFANCPIIPKRVRSV